jgi:hypothetical protein
MKTHHEGCPGSTGGGELYTSAQTLEKPEALYPETLDKKDIWYPEYGRYSQQVTYDRLDDIKEHLRETGFWDDQAEEDFINSVRFVDRVFEEYDDPESVQSKKSFAFVVPPRMERGREEYSAEVTTVLPIMRQYGSHTRQLIFTDIPPFVLDRYGEDHNERNGCILYTPIMADMMTDMKNKSRDFENPENQSSPKKVIQQIMEDTVGFAKENLDVDAVGLGAILPKLTKYGEDIKNNHPELTVTTGHAATVWLIGEILEKAINENYIEKPERVGIIGAGAIGRSTMHHLVESFGYDPEKVYVSDQKTNKSKEAANEIEGVNVANSNDELINNVDAVVSAVTQPIDMEKSSSGIQVEGKLIIDDSQPGSFDKEQVLARGGKLAWAIGQDKTPDHALTGGDFDYANTGPARHDQVWGCEAEAYIVHLYPELALHGREVKPEDVKQVGEKLRETGVEAAPLQSHGQEY